MRLDNDEIAAANRLASARDEDLTAVATGGAGDNPIAGQRSGAATGQRVRVGAAKVVGAPDRSMNVYAADGTVVAPLRII